MQAIDSCWGSASYCTIGILFTDVFRDTLAAAGVQTVRLSPRSPNLNAYAERFVRTIKESCLNRMILVGERSLRAARSASSSSTTITNGSPGHGQPVPLSPP